MLQTSLLLMKSLNKTETHIFLSEVCSLFPKAILLTFIFSYILEVTVLENVYSIKYLGVTIIIYDLRWKTHIRNI